MIPHHITSHHHQPESTISCLHIKTGDILTSSSNVFITAEPRNKDVLVARGGCLVNWIIYGKIRLRTRIIPARGVRPHLSHLAGSAEPASGNWNK